MDGKYKHIIDGFNDKLEDLDLNSNTSLKNINQGIHLCNDALYFLKCLIEKKKFASIEEEIHFFKKVKSIPLGYLVYFSEVRSCELLMPKVGNEIQLNFLEKKKRKINKFFNRNWDFVHYMEQDQTYLDVQYFTRENQVFPLYSLPEVCYLDPSFFTSHDMLWARIKGLTDFISYLEKRIKQINSLSANVTLNGSSNNKLVWSASKTAMTELIYALHSSSVVNNGKADIKRIASTFETVFDVQLDNIYKTYTEIKARKGSRGRFLEELVQRFNARMEADDDL